MCRYVKCSELWAALAAIAIHFRHLETAKIALAEINEVDKVQFLNYITNLPCEARRNAELALFCKRPAEAEVALLQGNPPRVFRAIEMNMRTYF